MKPSHFIAMIAAGMLALYRLLTGPVAGIYRLHIYSLAPKGFAQI